MSMTDVFKKRKEAKKELTLEDSYREMLKINTLRVFENDTNDVVAEDIAAMLNKDEKKVLKTLNSFGENKWWFSNEPEVIAVQQLKLGKDNIIVDSTRLMASVYCVTGELMSEKEMLKNWDDVWKNVQKKLGADKIKKITYTNEDWKREEDEAMAINLN